jgi:hypothetical protein
MTIAPSQLRERQAFLTGVDFATYELSFLRARRPPEASAHRNYDQSSLFAPGFLDVSSTRSPNSGSVSGIA